VLFFFSKFLVLRHVTTFCFKMTVEVMGRQLQDNYHTFFIGRLRWSYFPPYYDATVELRFNEVPRDCENLFVISRVRYIENLDLRNCLVSFAAVFWMSRNAPPKERRPLLLAVEAMPFYLLLKKRSQSPLSSRSAIFILFRKTY